MLRRQTVILTRQRLLPLITLCRQKRFFAQEHIYPHENPFSSLSKERIEKSYEYVKNPRETNQYENERDDAMVSPIDENLGLDERQILDDVSRMGSDPSDPFSLNGFAGDGQSDFDYAFELQNHRKEKESSFADSIRKDQMNELDDRSNMNDKKFEKLLRHLRIEMIELLKVKPRNFFESFEVIGNFLHYCTEMIGTYNMKSINQRQNLSKFFRTTFHRIQTIYDRSHLLKICGEVEINQDNTRLERFIETAFIAFDRKPANTMSNLELLITQDFSKEIENYNELSNNETKQYVESIAQLFVVIAQSFDFEFNEKEYDQHIIQLLQIRPIAQIYYKLPQRVQNGLFSTINRLEDPIQVAAELLQVKNDAIIEDTLNFLIDALTLNRAIDAALLVKWLYKQNIQIQESIICKVAERLTKIDEDAIADEMLNLIFERQTTLETKTYELVARRAAKLGRGQSQALEEALWHLERSANVENQSSIIKAGISESNALRAEILAKSGRFDECIILLEQCFNLQDFKDLLSSVSETPFIFNFDKEKPFPQERECHLIVIALIAIGREEIAERVIEKFALQGVIVSMSTIRRLLYSYVTRKDVGAALSLFESIDKIEEVDDPGILNALVKLFAQQGDVQNANKVIDLAHHRGVEINSRMLLNLLSAHIFSKGWDSADKLLKEICSNPVTRPGPKTFEIMAQSFLYRRVPVKDVFKFILKTTEAGYPASVNLFGTLIRAAWSARLSKTAEKIFSFAEISLGGNNGYPTGKGARPQMFAQMIGGYLKFSQAQKAQEYLDEFKRRDLKFNNTMRQLIVVSCLKSSVHRFSIMKVVEDLLKDSPESILPVYRPLLSNAIRSTDTRVVEDLLQIASKIRVRFSFSDWFVMLQIVCDEKNLIGALHLWKHIFDLAVERGSIASETKKVGKSMSRLISRHLSTIILALGKKRALDKAIQIWFQYRDAGFELTGENWNSMVKLLIQCHRFGSACEIVENVLTITPPYIISGEIDEKKRQEDVQKVIRTRSQYFEREEEKENKEDYYDTIIEEKDAVSEVSRKNGDQDLEKVNFELKFQSDTSDPPLTNQSEEDIAVSSKNPFYTPFISTSLSIQSPEVLKLEHKQPLDAKDGESKPLNPIQDLGNLIHSIKESQDAIQLADNDWYPRHHTLRIILMALRYSMREIGYMPLRPRPGFEDSVLLRDWIMMDVDSVLKKFPRLDTLLYRFAPILKYDNDSSKDRRRLGEFGIWLEDFAKNYERRKQQEKEQAEEEVPLEQEKILTDSTKTLPLLSYRKRKFISPYASSKFKLQENSIEDPNESNYEEYRKGFPFEPSDSSRSTSKNVNTGFDLSIENNNHQFDFVNSNIIRK